MGAYKSGLIAIVAGMAVVTGATGAAAEKWDFPTSYQDSNFHTATAKWFAEEVAKRTGNKLDFQLHTNQSLFKMPEMKRAVQGGQVNIAEFLLSAYANEDPIFEADAVPFTAVGYDNAWKLYQAQKPVLEKKLQAQGIRLLYSVAWPGQGLFTKTPVTSFADIKGAKMRAYNAATAKIAELSGAQGVTVQAGEVPQAFATGVINMMITSSATGADTKAWEYTKHYYKTNAWHPRNAVVVNERAFRRLPEDVQKAVLAVAEEAEKRGWDASRQIVSETEAKLVAGGMSVEAAPEAVMVDFRKIGEQMKADWLKRAGADGEAIMKAVQ